MKKDIKEFVWLFIGSSGAIWILILIAERGNMI